MTGQGKHGQPHIYGASSMHYRQGTAVATAEQPPCWTPEQEDDALYPYTIDDMRDVIEENLRLRASEANKADEIVEQGIKALKGGLMERESADLVKVYRDSAIAIQQRELGKALKMLEKGVLPKEVVGRLAHDLTNKLIHAPTAGLRQLAKEGEKNDVSKLAAVLGVPDMDDDLDETATIQ